MSSFTLKRGLQNVFVALVEADTDGEYVTGTPYHLIPAGEMSRTVSSDKTNVYYDNGIFYVSGKEGYTEITISGAALRPADIAALVGKTIDATTGAVLDTGEFKETFYALGGETDNVDGTKEMFWFLKGTFDTPDQTDKTKDDSTDTNGTSLKFTAIQTNHTFAVAGEQKKMKRVVIDTETSQLKAEQNWVAQVVTPDNIGTIVQKVAG